MKPGWVVYGPENGYNFPNPLILMVNLIYIFTENFRIFYIKFFKIIIDLAMNLTLDFQKDKNKKKNKDK